MTRDAWLVDEWRDLLDGGELRQQAGHEAERFAMAMFAEVDRLRYELDRAWNLAATAKEEYQRLAADVGWPS